MSQQVPGGPVGSWGPSRFLGPQQVPGGPVGSGGPAGTHYLQEADVLAQGAHAATEGDEEHQHSHHHQQHGRVHGQADHGRLWGEERSRRTEKSG